MSQTYLGALDIDIHRDKPDAVRVVVRGEIDEATVDQLWHSLLAVLDPDGITLLELDLAAVSFCDCAGLSEFLAIRRIAAQSGCEVTITAAGRPVEALLSSLGVGKTFGYPDPSADTTHVTAPRWQRWLRLNGRNRSGHPDPDSARPAQSR
jgi:anti-anti-sigma factor